MGNAANPHSHAENDDGSLIGNGQRKMAVAGQEYGLSKNSVARLLRINKLEPSIKNLLDHEIIGTQATDGLPYLSPEGREGIRVLEFFRQESVVTFIMVTGINPLHVYLPVVNLICQGIF